MAFPSHSGVNDPIYVYLGKNLSFVIELDLIDIDMPVVSIH